MASQEYWLISAPGDKTCQQTWDKLQAATCNVEKPLSINSKYQLPDLKVIMAIITPLDHHQQLIAAIIQSSSIDVDCRIILKLNFMSTFYWIINHVINYLTVILNSPSSRRYTVYVTYHTHILCSLARLDTTR